MRNEIHEKQQMQPTKRFDHKAFWFAHIEVALLGNLGLLLMLYLFTLFFPTFPMDALISINLIAILCSGVIWYRKHTTY